MGALTTFVHLVFLVFWPAMQIRGPEDKPVVHGIFSLYAVLQLNILSQQKRKTIRS